MLRTSIDLILDFNLHLIVAIIPREKEPKIGIKIIGIPKFSIISGVWRWVKILYGCKLTSQKLLLKLAFLPAPLTPLTALTTGV